MILLRTAGRLGLVATAALTLAVLLELSHRADGALRAHEAADQAGTSAADAMSTERETSRLVIHLDRGLAPNCLVEGWSGAEPNFGVWSVGHRAVLKLGGLQAGPAEVALTLQPFSVPGRPVQRVSVRAQGRPLGDWSLTGSAVRTLHLSVPADARAATGEVVLELALPDADAPARRVAGSKDGREIAINLKRIEASAGGV
jgi:hypothetical protein